MKRPVFISVWICVLAIWMQLLAPAISLAMTQADGLPSVICTHASEVVDADGAEKAGSTQAPHKHASGDCCPLCHHAVTALPTPDRPSFTRFDYPVASPLRWARTADSFVVQLVGDHPPARGPPRLV